MALCSESPGSSGGESGDEGSLLDGSPGQILAVTAARLAAIKAAMARGNARGDMTGSAVLMPAGPAAALHLQ